jgi:opacity protein-like surface antigen
MKRRIRVTTCVTALLIFEVLISGAYAMPRGYSASGMNYIEGSSDLSRWSLGFYSYGRNREVEIDNVDLTLETMSVMGYVGYDLKRWLTFYATAGTCNFTIEEYSECSSGELGFGLKANLLDHEILDPTLFEDKIQLNAAVECSLASFEWLDSSTAFVELSGSLTLGLINDIEGNKFFLPNSIGIFAGGVISDFVADNVSACQKLGYTAGMDLFYSENVTLEIRMEGFEGTSFMGGINLRL